MRRPGSLIVLRWRQTVLDSLDSLSLSLSLLMGSSKLSMTDSVALDIGTFPSHPGSSAHCARGLSADGNNRIKKEKFVAAECEGYTLCWPS